MSGETQHADGRRTVGLYMPFTAAGIRVKAITFEPSTFGHLQRWNSGHYASAMALMMELSKRDLYTLESIRHPDDARVMKAFLDHVQPQIAEDIQAGVRPRSAGEVITTEFEPAPADVGVPTEQDPEWGGSRAPLADDALAGYEGQEFETVPGRPIDHVEGLDS
jgi:hypothetical protein